MTPAQVIPRPIAGYLRAYRRWQAQQARLDARLDALAPLRRKVAELRDQLRVREGRLTGGQLGAVRRILAHDCQEMDAIAYLSRANDKNALRQNE